MMESFKVEIHFLTIFPRDFLFGVKTVFHDFLKDSKRNFRSDMEKVSSCFIICESPNSLLFNNVGKDSDKLCKVI